MNPLFTAIFVLLTLPAGWGQISAQASRSTPAKEDISSIIRDIEDGVRSDDAGFFSGHLARQVAISLRDNENGYYSGNQAAYIIRNFFQTKRTIQFRLTTTQTTDQNAFATGGGSFSIRGTVVRLQLYVGFARQENRWVINQFNVY